MRSGALMSPSVIAAPTGQDGHNVTDFCLGHYRTLSIESILEFPESTQNVMTFQQRTLIEVLTPTRFFERRFHWTGSGVIDTPRVEGQIDGGPVSMKRHGPLYQIDALSAYLVDMGRLVARGSRPEIVTTGRFIDEAMQFEPYLSVKSAATLATLSATVRLRRRVKVRAEHKSPPDEGDLFAPPATPIEVVEEQSEGFYNYRVRPEVVQQGHYVISWT